jgi:hypothetical protein
MKLIIIGVVIITVILLYSSCKVSKVNLIYAVNTDAQMVFSFKFLPDDSISQTINLLPQKVKKQSEASMYILTEFQGQRKYAEKVLSLTLKLYAMNENTGQYEDEVKILNTYSHFEYNYYYYNTFGFGEKNYTDDLNKLMYKSDDNPEDRMNSLIVDNELRLDKYPKQIKAVVHVSWIGGEKDFITYITLDERKIGPKVRTNPFG